MDQKNRKAVLSIETAITGGSLCLSENGKEVDSWIGETEVSKAEDVLEQVKNLFERNAWQKDSLDLIAVSNGPGSLTGLKIGLSIAKGLRKALDCELVQFSMHRFLFLQTSKNVQSQIITALPFGNDLISWQRFEKSAANFENPNPPQISTAADFSDRLNTAEPLQIFCHQKVFLMLTAFVSEKKIPDNIILTDIGLNVAKFYSTEKR